MVKINQTEFRNFHLLMTTHLTFNYSEQLETIPDARFLLIRGSYVLDISTETFFWIKFKDFCAEIYLRDKEYNLWIKLPYSYWENENKLETPLWMEIRNAFNLLERSE